MSDCSIPESYDDGTGFEPTDEYTTTDYTTDSYTEDPYSASSTMSVDLDQDGIAETTITDFDGDGVGDMFDTIDPATGVEVLTMDADGDGFLDTIAVDADGDGVLDAAAMDLDGDGAVDTVFDPNTGEELSIDDPFAPYDDPTIDPIVEDPELDPELETAEDGVHGEPMAEIPYHQAQVSDNDCLPTSVAMVLSEATGTEVPQGDVVDVANELGLLGPSGMSMEGGLALFEHWGVEAEVETGSVDELRTLLDAGTPVIIGLDADDLYGTGDEPFADDLVSGHAVVITGIDDEAGLVYINDPGFPDGAGVAIPIEEFEDAWQDADNTMIVAETSVGDTDLTSADAGSAGSESIEAIPGLHGEDETVGDATEDGGVVEGLRKLILLPFNLVVR